jgi:cell division protein ZapA
VSRRKPAAPRHTVTVEIAGDRHILRSDAPPEYTRAVAAHVDATVRALPPTLEPHRAAILAALSITDELFRAREEIQAVREESARRAATLSAVLEAAEAGRPIPPPESAETAGAKKKAR